MGWDRSALARRAAGWALLTAAWLCASCHDPTTIVGKLAPPGAADADAARADAATDPAGAVSGAAGSSSDFAPGAQTDDAEYRVSLEPGARNDVCTGKGPVLVGTRSGASAPDCAWRPERRIFSYGLCACEELRLDGSSFVLDSFDSQQGAYKSAQTGAAIGVNGVISQLAADTQVLGDVISAGAAELALIGPSLLVAGDLKQRGALRLSAGSVHVMRDLWLASDALSTQGTLMVEHDAHQSAGRTGLGPTNVRGRVLSGDVRVPPPCDCGAAPVIDVPALVAQAKADNDDTAVGLSPDALDLDMYATDWKPLPCGRLYLKRIALQGLSTYFVTVVSRTAIFVEGDLTVSSLATLIINGGELDLFVSGDLTVEAMSSLLLGNTGAPSSVRLYVAGQIRIDGTLVLGAQLYAPNATLELPASNADVELYGSIFARAIHLPNERMHYDRAILHAAPACSAPAPQACDGCNQCPDDLACTAGTCGACTADADCCEPAVCNHGKCQALVSDWP